MREGGRWARAWVPPVLWFAMLGLLIFATHRAALPELAPVISIEAAASEVADDDELPLATSEWQTHQMPLRTCRVRCETPFVLLRHRFTLARVPPEDWAVYLPYFDANVAVYLNGHKLDQRGRMRPPADLYRFHSRLTLLPPTALRAGENELLLHLVSEVRHLGGIAPFYLGPASALAGPHRWRVMLTEQSVAGVAWLQAGSFLLALALYLAGRRENVLGWYLLAAPFWLLLGILHLSPTWPVPGYGRWAAFHAALLGVMTFTPVFIISIVRPAPRWLVRALLTFLALGLLVAWSALASQSLSAYWRVQLPNYVLKLTSLTLVPWMLWLVSRIVLARAQSRSAPWLVAFAAMPALLGITDAVHGSVAPPMEFALLPFGALGLVLTLWLELARRVMQFERQTAAHAQQLQQTLSAREAELAQSFERIREADRERALAAERQRLLRDMHDGVGGQLASLVHLAGNPQVGREQVVSGLREGLADLRLVLDSLAQSDDDLLVALGRLRHRIEPTLVAAGMRLEWEVDARLELPPWPPEAVLHLYRCVQEAANNAIRHAQARTLRVGLRAEGEGLLLEVADDGCGFDPAQAGNGHGLAGLRARAGRLGGEFAIASRPGAGTRLCWRLPLQPKEIAGAEDHALPVVQLQRGRSGGPLP